MNVVISALCLFLIRTGKNDIKKLVLALVGAIVAGLPFAVVAGTCTSLGTSIFGVQLTCDLYEGNVHGETRDHIDSTLSGYWPHRWVVANNVLILNQSVGASTEFNVENPPLAIDVSSILVFSHSDATLISRADSGFEVLLASIIDVPLTPGGSLPYDIKVKGESAVWVTKPFTVPEFSDVQEYCCDIVNVHSAAPSPVPIPSAFILLVSALFSLCIRSGKLAIRL
ncbi:MAG: hypothetical protein AB7Q97_02285 [Gammaproteobacteria bacterium]